MKNGAEAPIFRIAIQLHLSVHEIAQHELLNTVADGVHAAGPFEIICGFEFFRDALDLCVLPDEVVVHLPRVPVEVDQVLLERSIHTHYLSRF